MKLYHLFSKDFAHDDCFEFTVYAKSHQQAFNLAKEYAMRYDDYYFFDDDITNWDIEEVKLEKPQIIQDSVLYG